MPEKYHLPISTTGALDTANPVGDRPLGTLIEATDVAPRYWGPRKGSQAFTRVWEGPGTASLYDAIKLTVGSNTYGIGHTYDDQYRDLGTSFTLDLWFRLDDTAYASGLANIGIYHFQAGSVGYIKVWVRSDLGGASKEGKIEVLLATSATLSSTDSTKGITSTNAISVGSGQDRKHHLRLVRDGGDLTLYVDGVNEGSNANLVATSPINSARGTISRVRVGTVESDTPFKGSIYGAVLRDGAYTSEPIEAVMPCAPWAQNVHHFILGRKIDFGGDDHYFDAGRYAVHPRIIGSDYTITSSNDDTAPAPATVQGLATWTTRTNRTATSVIAGGVLSTSMIA